MINIGKTPGTALTNTDESVLAAQKKKNTLPELTTPMAPMQRAIQAPPPNPVEQNVQDAIVPFQPNLDQNEDEVSFDILDFLSDLENQPQNPGPNAMALVPKDKNVPVQQSSKLKNTTQTISQNLLQQRNSLIFHSCKIGNITINLNKNL